MAAMPQGLTERRVGETVAAMFALRLTPHFIFPTRAYHGTPVSVTLMDVMDAPPDRTVA